MPMIVELGHFALILAFAVAIVQSTLPLYGAARRDSRLMALAEPAALIQLILVATSFAALTYAFVVSDFSLRLVTLNSHTDKPMLYKVSGVWGNHEGSLLLWSLSLALFGACAVWFGGNLPATLKARVLAVQGMIGVAFMAFMLFTSNPFLRLANPPLNGDDLNPLLQDPGLAFHPPFLYLGYVGLSMAFSFAVAALIEGRVDAAWARWVRPWTLAAWVFLTIVVEKRESLKAWTILLAIMAFGFSLIGTFIVRSGVITSVHSFANDPERGVFILMILGVFMGGALTLFAFRAGTLEAKGLFSTVSRESALLANNVLLAVSCFVVFIGTIWPLVAEMLWDRKLSVGEPFFNAAFTPFMVILALILPVGAMMPWKRAEIGRSLRPLRGALALAVALGLLIYAMQTGRSALGPIGAALGAWVVLGAAVDLWTRAGRGSIGSRLSRLGRMGRADWGKATAHSGLGVTIFAVAAMHAWAVEDIRVVRIGETFPVGPYEVLLKDVRDVQGPNYLSTTAEMVVTRGGAEVATLFPEKRVYPVQAMPTTEAAIDYGFARDIYLVIGDPQVGGGFAVRSYVKPFANWLWGGSALMALGGFFSLTDRRYRLAAGARRQTPAAQPAE
jgi:cytochrome c-type biogenesis protein CcmF